MAKKIDDGKSQIILIMAVVIIAVFMLFGMFNKNGKDIKNRIANSYCGVSCPPMAILLCSNELAI